LHKVGVEPEILLQLLIGAFGLAVGLLVVSSRKCCLNA
jgi:hypothetical protein